MGSDRFSKFRSQIYRMNRELESPDFLRAGMKKNPCGGRRRYNQVEVLKSKKAGEIFLIYVRTSC
ncbi:hypothetical protein [Geitlerinema sp. PCC 9228]|jgi:hypothetical protein|uniref:hypothetical protein n=1 Tax=Geitlerinema sp. PCC 9228 TaxID=111611 RepID=UPI00111474B0|nr:hypothetical protein [Geitlerinema sp. PCC 9228]